MTEAEKGTLFQRIKIIHEARAMPGSAKVIGALGALTHGGIDHRTFLLEAAAEFSSCAASLRELAGEAPGVTSPQS